MNLSCSVCREMERRQAARKRLAKNLAGWIAGANLRRAVLNRIVMSVRVLAGVLSST
jgi:hypothetical protein